MARPLAPLALVAAVAVVAACSAEEIISTTEPVTGPGVVYALASTNDRTLPATFTQDGNAFEVRKGALTLAPDSTFIFSIALRVSASGAQPSNSTQTFRGTYQRSGDAVALRQQGDTLFLGTYAPTSVSLQRGTAQVAGNRFVFVR
jgi:ABC-type taurine transport system ATPase subunit